MTILRLLLSSVFKFVEFTNITLCVRFSGISLKTLKQLVTAFNGMNVNSSIAGFLRCFAGYSSGLVQCNDFRK